jgi:hypothetical protein
LHTFVTFFFVIFIITLIREAVMLCLGNYPEPKRAITLRAAVRSSLVVLALGIWAGCLLFV